MKYLHGDDIVEKWYKFSFAEQMGHVGSERWKTGLKELTRVKELLCDTAFGENQYHTSLEDLDRYFTKFALASRLDI